MFWVSRVVDLADIQKMSFRALLSAAVLALTLALAPVAEAGVGSKSIVAVGDIACPPGSAVTATKCRQEQVAALTRRIDPDQLWLAGDIQYPVGAPSDFAGGFGSAFGDMKSISRPVPGNHEYYTANAAGYYGYFGARAGKPTRGYYSFNIGAWHVVALNSNCEFVACGYGSAQLRWLARDLKSNPDRCIAAIWHHPLYSSGEHGSNPQVRPIWKALLRARAEFAVVGHDHDFEAFLPQNADGVLRPATGMREYVVGTGGRELYPLSATAVNRQSAVQGSFGVMAVELKPRGWSWRFVDESDRTLSSGRGSCR